MSHDDDPNTPHPIAQSTAPGPARGRSKSYHRSRKVPNAGNVMSADQMADLAAKAAAAVVERMSAQLTGSLAAVQDAVASVAERLAAVEGQPTPRRVVPPRAGEAQAPAGVDLDDSYDPLDPKVQRQARARLGAEPSARVPHATGMTDEEVIAMFQGEEIDEFTVPPDIIPDGLAYGWWAIEVLGKETTGKVAELARRGWTDVRHEDHPGVWGTEGSTGPIVLKGQKLMKRSAEMHALRQQYQRALAKQAVRDKVAQMQNAPPGTGPRTHEKVRPQITRRYEPLPVE